MAAIPHAGLRFPISIMHSPRYEIRRMPPMPGRETIWAASQKAGSRKAKQFQIINRFKIFEFLLNRL
jgi:hypothetical protein